MNLRNICLYVDLNWDVCSCVFDTISYHASPNPVQAKISYCASGTGIFQCFIKDNDCEAFEESHNGTECLRSKT